MIDKHDTLYKDLEAVKQIEIVPSMLDIVCRITGLGFAAIARVTEDRWLACSVLDKVNFGLAEGGELKVETTICDEIRNNREAVVIDHVSEDSQYKDHHTPRLYGLQSYISFPIILKNGEFFGTLCAIGAEPAILSKPEITGTFKLFSELLAFHLQSIDLMERSQSALQESLMQLIHTSEENKQYQQISDHNLQEKVRKITVFSDLLVNHAGLADPDKIKKIAVKIHSFAEELSGMIKHVTKFSSASAGEIPFESVDLNQTVLRVRALLASELKSDVVMISDELPVISAISEQMSQLFFQLGSYVVTFSKNNGASGIHIQAKPIEAGEISHLVPAGKQLKFCEILFECKDMDIEPDLKNIFDIFVHLSEQQNAGSYGAGLAYCRKLVHNHGGVITAHTLPDQGISFRIILPVDYDPALVQQNSDRSLEYSDR